MVRAKENEFDPYMVYVGTYITIAAMSILVWLCGKCASSFSSVPRSKKPFRVFYWVRGLLVVFLGFRVDVGKRHTHLYTS